MSVSKAVKTLGVAMFVAMAAFALMGCSLTGGLSQSDDNGITVNASSETKIVPDKARISVSVLSDAKEAERCQNENAESVNAVIAALKALGVAEESIQTHYSDLSPRYGSRTSKNDKEEYDDWVITGYEMTTMLTISDLDIDNVGAIIQACVAAGANEANGVEYYVSDYDAAYNETLAKALETARVKAECIASSAGVSLGKVINVVEGYQDTSYRYAMENKDYAMAESAEDSGGVAMETMPGQVDITAQVTVTFAIS